MLVYNKADVIVISLKINLFLSWYGWKIAELSLNNNHSLTQIISSLKMIEKLFRFKIAGNRLVAINYINSYRNNE